MVSLFSTPLPGTELWIGCHDQKFLKIRAWGYEIFDITADMTKMSSDEYTELFQTSTSQFQATIVIDTEPFRAIWPGGI